MPISNNNQNFDFKSVNNKNQIDFKNRLKLLKVNSPLKGIFFSSVEYMNPWIVNTNLYKPTFLYKPQSASDFFEKSYISPGLYGADQGRMYQLCYFELNGVKYPYYNAQKLINEAIANGKPLPNFNIVEHERFTELKLKLMDKYNITAEEAAMILNLIDYTGACSYGAVCNEILLQFSNNPTYFEQVFGYPMYRKITDSNGNVSEVLNAEELLVDLYMFANDQNNGGALYLDGKINPGLLSSTVDPFGRQLPLTEFQVYLGDGMTKNNEVINMFLKSKDPRLSYNSITYIEQSNPDDSSSIVPQILEAMDQGKSVTIGWIYCSEIEPISKVIHMNSFDEKAYSNYNTSYINTRAGHEMLVTGVNEEGFIVASWGNKYVIPFEDLNLGVNASLSISDISLK